MGGDHRWEQVNMGGIHRWEQSACVKTEYTGPAMDHSMNYELSRQPQGAPERERPTPTATQMPKSPLQDASLINMIQGTVETNRILGEYLRRDLHTRREEDVTRANDRRGNSPKYIRFPNL